jgi:glycerol-3-phosphate dehydrogenase (NAD(P)+)
MTDIAVLGGGSWGTALACHLARQGHGARLLFRSTAAAETVAARRVNEPYLPGVRLPSAVEVTSDPVRALEGVSLVLVVTPVKGLDLAASWIESHAPSGVPLVSCAKGLRPDTRQTPLGWLAARHPDRASQLAVLSGPTFAQELARGDPSAAVIASRDAGVAARVQAIVTGGSFRLYTNDDPFGVEIAGALKNIMALAAGMVDGLGYGSNTLAALITRGLSEMTRLGTALGGAPSTFAGLAGMGDLVLTCTGGWSRNRRVGQELAKGQALEAIVAGMRMVAEGVVSTEVARDLARQHAVEMPIVEQVAAILFEGRHPARALAALLARDPREEGPGASAGRGAFC